MDKDKNKQLEKRIKELEQQLQQVIKTQQENKEED